MQNSHKSRLVGKSQDFPTTAMLVSILLIILRHTVEMQRFNTIINY